MSFTRFAQEVTSLFSLHQTQLKSILTTLISALGQNNAGIGSDLDDHALLRAR
jgi:hypothetical protein